MVTAVEIADFLRREFPQTKCVVEAVGDGTSTVSIEITVHELRPGGTVFGPVLMSVADSRKVEGSGNRCRPQWSNGSDDANGAPL